MQKMIKRVFDFCFALFVLIFAIPIILLTIICIMINSPEDSPIFKQTRIGYKGKRFTILKLRTMTNEKDENGNLLSDEQRLKTWGKVIRKLSIDELTQIFNILLGQMSWIGPRPLLPHEMEVMTAEEQVVRQSMLPGITGWEAVNEDKTDSRAEMAQYDLHYIKNWSLLLDMKIFFMTIVILLFGNRADDAYRAPKVNEAEIVAKDT